MTTEEEQHGSTTFHSSRILIKKKSNHRHHHWLLHNCPMKKLQLTRLTLGSPLEQLMLSQHLTLPLWLFLLQ